MTNDVRPIETAGDFAGLKIRSPGGEIAADFFRALGAEAGMVPFSGMYDALKAKTFDGQSDPLGVVLSLRLYEVQRYLSLTAHWWTGFTLLANANAWNALPAEIRAVVERHAEAAALAQRADIEAVNAAGAGSARTTWDGRQHRRRRQYPRQARRVLRALAGALRSGGLDAARRGGRRASRLSRHCGKGGPAG